MLRLIFLLATVSVAYGFVDFRNYDGLRVKFGWSDGLAESDYFFSVPRTVVDAENYGWLRTQNPLEELPDLKMYCFVKRCVCGLYDVGGFIAALQIGLPIDEYQMPDIKHEFKFKTWHAPHIYEDPSTEYLVLTQFLVSPDSLKAGIAPTIENGQTLQDNGVWVSDLKGKLMRIPLNESEIKGTLFKKQNCVPNMGTHYYYNMTSEMECEKLLPWFALYTKGGLVGTGFQFFGKISEMRWRQWFETPPAPRQSAQLVIPNGPSCLYDWAEKYKVISLHIYYIKKPWYIKCKSGDSVKPGPVLDRLWFNGYRYASKIMDQIRHLFSG